MNNSFIQKKFINKINAFELLRILNYLEFSIAPSKHTICIFIFYKVCSFYLDEKFLNEPLL